jgi:hypothetical protein
MNGKMLAHTGAGTDIYMQKQLRLSAAILGFKGWTIKVN